MTEKWIFHSVFDCAFPLAVNSLHKQTRELCGWIAECTASADGGGEVSTAVSPLTCCPRMQRVAFFVCFDEAQALFEGHQSQPQHQPQPPTSTLTIDNPSTSTGPSPKKPFKPPPTPYHILTSVLSKLVDLPCCSLFISTQCPPAQDAAAPAPYTDDPDAVWSPTMRVMPRSTLEIAPFTALGWVTPATERPGCVLEPDEEQRDEDAEVGFNTYGEVTDS